MLFLKISQNSQENTCVEGVTFVTPTQVFSSEYLGI